MVVDFSAAALHNEDIFLSNALAYYDLRFAYAEFREVDLGGRDAEIGADCFGQLGMGGSGEDDDVADHLCGGPEVVVGMLRVFEAVALRVDSLIGKTDIESACHCHRAWCLLATARLLDHSYCFDV